MKKYGVFTVAFVIAIIAGTGVFALFADIAGKKSQERQYPLMLNKVSDLEPDFAKWGQNFPSQLDDYMAMKDDLLETPFGGSVSFSKIIRWPASTVFWNGYAFAVDYNKPRTHYYAQIDQMEIKRNDKEYLNAHGLPAFKGQPGACVNCHTGYLTALMKDPDFKLSENPNEASKMPMPFFDVDKQNGQSKKQAWTKMNSMPYFDVMKVIENKHGDGIHGSHMGSTCADCHHPDDMSLRVTRPAFVNAMVSRGYEADVKSGIKAKRADMRNYVCMQCHVEYYFGGKDQTLTFPWSKWEKDKEFKIENFDEYYDEKFANGQFKFDYKHKDTDAPIIKMQHSEAELYSTSVHAKSGVTCVDCHMPYKREGAVKITEHNIQTPYANLTASCKTCHPISEDKLKKRINFIQNRHAYELRVCESSLLALIEDIKVGREKLSHHSDFANLEAKDQKAKISKALEKSLWMQRKAHIRWDFAFSENSLGFHGPEEAARILGQCKDFSRQGQLELSNALSEYGISIQLTKKGTFPTPPARLDHKPPVGNEPSATQIKLDKDIEQLNF